MAVDPNRKPTTAADDLPSVSALFSKKEGEVKESGVCWVESKSKAYKSFCFPSFFIISCCL